MKKKTDLHKLKKLQEKVYEKTRTNMNKYTTSIQKIQIYKDRDKDKDQGFFGPNEFNKRAESWLRQKHLVLPNGDSAHSLLNTLNILPKKYFLSNTLNISTRRYFLLNTLNISTQKYFLIFCIFSLTR